MMAAPKINATATTVTAMSRAIWTEELVLFW